MSLEKSMETLAESNLKLAASFDRYADVVERFGLKIEKDNEDPEDKPKAAAKPAAEKKSPGRPKKQPEPEPENDDDDGLGDDDDDAIEAPAGLTLDQVKKKLLDVKAAFDGDKQHALDVIAPFGYKGVTEIKEKHYDDIWVAAETKLRSK